MSSKRIFIITLITMLTGILHAQERTVENRPYTDLRPFHFGVVVGTHMQDIELNNVGPITLTDENGMEYESFVSTDQDRWDPGFQVGVLGELRLSTHFALRLSPTLYFGTRHITFINHMKPDEDGKPTEARQTLKSVYSRRSRPYLQCETLQQPSPVYRCGNNSYAEPHKPRQ